MTVPNIQTFVMCVLITDTALSKESKQKCTRQNQRPADKKICDVSQKPIKAMPHIQNFPTKRIPKVKQLEEPAPDKFKKLKTLEEKRARKAYLYGRRKSNMTKQFIRSRDRDDKYTFLTDYHTRECFFFIQKKCQPKLDMALKESNEAEIKLDFTKSKLELSVGDYKAINNKLKNNQKEYNRFIQGNKILGANGKKIRRMKLRLAKIAIEKEKCAEELLIAKKECTDAAEKAALLSEKVSKYKLKLGLL